MFHVLQPKPIELFDVIIIESVKDLATVLAAADEAKLAQSAQLMRNSRFGHRELRGKLTDIPFAVEQERNDPQTCGVTEGAEQVSQVGGRIFFEYHRKYMNNCSIIHNYSIEK